MPLKNFRVLRRIMKETHATKVWYSFLIFFFICAVLIWLRDGSILYLKNYFRSTLDLRSRRHCDHDRRRRKLFQPSGRAPEEGIPYSIN